MAAGGEQTRSAHARDVSLGARIEDVPIVFEVIHQMSRSYGLKNRRLESNLSKITKPVAGLKSLGFALFN